MNISIEYTIDLKNCVSTGGIIEVKMGVNGEIAFIPKGGSEPNRRDFRVDLKDLEKAIEAAKILNEKIGVQNLIEIQNFKE
jgi:hypothetical protein